MNSVLVVDDESAIRELLTRWLSAAGYDVRSAPDSAAALVEMARSAADVVMCDVEMPGHDGLWLADQLRERFPHAAMVLATGVDSVPAATSFKPGIIEYLVKPLERARVLTAVANAVRWHDEAPERVQPSANREATLSEWIDSTDEPKH